YLPLINDPEYNFSTINVEVQQNNASSLLWWMKRMINIRKQFQAFGRGDIRFLSPENAKVLAFTRSYEDEHLLVVANLSRHAQSVDLELPEFERYRPVEAFGQTVFPPIGRGQNRFTVGPYGYYWFVLEPEHQNGRIAPHIPELKWTPEDWLEMAQDKKNAPAIQRLIKQFLSRTNKYNLDQRKLEQIQIVKLAPLRYEGGRSLLLIIRTLYTEGFPEIYFIPLAMRKGDYQRQPNAPSASQIICQLTGGEQEGYLFEADESASFRNFLIRYLTEEGGQLPKDFQFVHSEAIRALPEKQPLPPARVISTRSNHRALAFGDQYFLKVFRRLENALNPEYEINRYGQHHDLPVPGYLSHLQYQPPGEPPYILAMLEPYVANQGTAWQYFYDSARRFVEQLTIDTESEESEEQGPKSIEERIGDMPLLRAQLLGEAVANFHVGMIDRHTKGFEPEEFSLHYQRSLFSAWNSQLRSTFQQLRKSGRLTELAKQLQEKRPLILDQLRRIYDHKIDAAKIRIHGDLQLEKVLFTGREFILFNFEGDRTRSFSELRLRKSPISDLASLSSSLYYAAMAALSTHIKPDPLTESELLAWVEAWYEQLQNAFMKGYFPIARQAHLLPESEEDLQLLWQTFFLERQLYELNYELQQQREWELIPYRGLMRLLEKMEVVTGE
ncbi:MAG TPA: alpha-glucosidase C-terminal domain-containing protein, partial [Phaeodactylibacter sp.]|nr:alpha-glucosidase C-terminal domain-containing protein [Phaeodactylibacter sp.]